MNTLKQNLCYSHFNFLLITILFITGCESGKINKQISTGMTAGDVESILGKPLCIETGIPDLKTDAETLTVVKRNPSGSICWIYSTSREKKITISGLRFSPHFLLNNKEVDFFTYNSVKDGDLIYLSPKGQLISKQMWINYRMVLPSQTPDPFYGKKSELREFERDSSLINYSVTECLTVIFDKKQVELHIAGITPALYYLIKPKKKLFKFLPFCL